MGKADIGCELMECESAMRRMDKVWLPSYAVALSICGKTNRALGVLSELLTDKPDNDLLAIGYLSCPDALLDPTRLKAFIAREMVDKDLKCFKAISKSYGSCEVS
jgi:hypothetical protein